MRKRVGRMTRRRNTKKQKLNTKNPSPTSWKMNHVILWNIIPSSKL